MVVMVEVVRVTVGVLGARLRGAGLLRRPTLQAPWVGVPQGEVPWRWPAARGVLGATRGQPRHRHTSVLTRQVSSAVICLRQKNTWIKNPHKHASNQSHCQLLDISVLIVYLRWQWCWWCWVLALHRGSEQPVCYQGRPLSSYWRDQDPPVAIVRYRHYGKKKNWPAVGVCC